jgi:hypothetical protein
MTTATMTTAAMTAAAMTTGGETGVRRDCGAGAENQADRNFA